MPIALRCRVALPALLLALALPAGAQQGWVAVLKNTPAERFDDQDLQLFLVAARKALEATPVDGTVVWENPDTSHHGELTVLKEFTWQGADCRRLRMVSHADGRRGDHRANLCHIDGRWRAVTQSQLKK